MRQNALPILEAWGVDLVMSGHSHSYERSFLIDSHYGISDSLNLLTEVLDGGDGSVGGDGAYVKPPVVAAEHAGAVYAVAGSSGKVSSLKPDAPHEAMYITLQALGSLVEMTARPKAAGTLQNRTRWRHWLNVWVRRV